MSKMRRWTGLELEDITCGIPNIEMVYQATIYEFILDLIKIRSTHKEI